MRQARRGARQVGRCAKGVFTAAEVDAALDAMRLEHKITGEMVKTKGRPSKVWRWNFARFPVAGVVETNETTPEPAQAVEIAPPAELPPAVAERSHEALNDLVEATIRIGNYESASEFAARLPDAERRAMQRRIAGLVDAETVAASEIEYDAGPPAAAADAPHATAPSESRTSEPDAVETSRGPVVAKDVAVIDVRFARIAHFLGEDIDIVDGCGYEPGQDDDRLRERAEMAELRTWLLSGELATPAGGSAIE